MPATRARWICYCLFLITPVTQLCAAEDAPLSIEAAGEDLAVQVDIKRLSFSPDGKTLLVGSDNSYGVYWLVDVPVPQLRAPGIQGPDAINGTDRPPLQEPEIGGRYMAAEAARFTNDSKTLLVLTHRTMQAWNVATGKPLGKAASLGGLVQAQTCALNPVTGDLFITSRSTSFERGPMGQLPLPVAGVAINPATGRKASKPLRFDQRPWPGNRDDWNLEQAIYSPNGKLLAILHRNGVARLWDVQAAKELVPDGLSDAAGVSHIAWSPDGKRLLVHNEQGAQLWDPVALKRVGDPVKTAGADRGTSPDEVHFRTAFSPDSTTLATTVYGNGRGHDVQLVNAESGKVERTFPTATSRSQPIHYVSYAGKSLMVLQERGTAIVPWLWDPATGKALAAPTELLNIRVAAISPDGKHLATYFNERGARKIRIWKIPAVE